MCIYTVKKQKFAKNYKIYFLFLNIFENNFYMVIKRASNGKRHYILPVCNMTCLNLC